jgi:hypothetical protein
VKTPAIRKKLSLLFVDHACHKRTGPVDFMREILAEEFDVFNRYLWFVAKGATMRVREKFNFGRSRQF